MTGGNGVEEADGALCATAPAGIAAANRTPSEADASSNFVIFGAPWIRDPAASRATEAIDYPHTMMPPDKNRRSAGDQGII
jgi:hypothetical protein